MLETSPTIVGIHHIQMEAPPGCEEAARTFYSDILSPLPLLLQMEPPTELVRLAQQSLHDIAT